MTGPERSGGGGLFDGVRDAARPGDPAVTTGLGTWTFGELLDTAERLAKRLADVADGTLLVAQVTDPAATAVLALAADHAGLPVLHADPGAAANPAGLLVRDTGVPAPDAARWSGGRLELTFTPSGPPPALTGVTGSAQIFLTSGSSGVPAGVVRPASAVLADCARIAGFLGYADGRAVLAGTPAFHSYGFTYGLFAPLLHGVHSGHRSPRSLPSQLARSAEQLQPATLIGLPVLFQLLTRAAEGVLLPGVVQAVSSGAPLDPRVAAEVAGRFPFRLFNAYGSSETGAVSLAAVEPGRPVLAGAVGRPLEGITARLDTAAGGELLLRTDSLAAGYLGADGLRPLRTDGDWYRTGDLAQLPGGRILLLGRAGDVINVAGEKVHPQEIESVLLRHPKVREAQVLGEADAARGQVPVARVVTVEPVAAEDLVRWCRTHLAPHQVPRRIDFLDELPRSATGKRIRGLAP